jgi:hypothetical protein
MRDEFIQLDEASRIQEQLNTLARREFACRVLLSDTFFSAPRFRKGIPLLEFLHKIRIGHEESIPRPWGVCMPKATPFSLVAQARQNPVVCDRRFGRGKIGGMRATGFFFSILAGFLGAISTAWAGPAFYVDASGGLVRENSNDGFGVNLGMWTSFTHNEGPMQFQLGVQDRYSSFSSSGSDLSTLNIPYVVARLQASIIYLGFGYSPYVMGENNSSGSSTSLSHVSGASSVMGQVGFLAPVTPKFSFGAEGSYQTLNGGALSGSSATYGISALMRFYFDFANGNSGSSNEFHGWRYPFGE